ncbi:MAG: putative Ig domain-containing protein [Verrucomicrobia bacterium]|nr:putative Ig domain-containing protein [Verrucomicrobiota bacterium]
MQFSLIRQAAFLGASAFALATSAAFSQEWTSFQVNTLTSSSFPHAHLPDGRFLFGIAGEVYVQDSFGAAAKTAVAKPNGLSFDPSFIATRSATEALIGGGGFAGASGVYLFNPSAPATAIISPGLTSTLQNYGAVYWQHPNSGREGWIVVGANATGSSNLSYVSADGLTAGAITGVLSDYSGGLAVAPNADIYTVRSAFGPPDGEVIKFTANQIDAAVASLATTPAPLALSAATVIFQGSASGSLAIDSLSRIWLGGYQIDYLQAHDPASGITRRFYPDHAALLNAVGTPNYAPKTFVKDSESYVSFLANDGFYTTGSGLVLGYKKDSELNVRSVQITSSSQTVLENAGSVSITVTITPAPTGTVTVPFTISGTATAGQDYSVSGSSLSFDASNTTRTVSVSVLDDRIIREADETIIVKLGRPAPVSTAGLGAANSDTVTLTIRDNDASPTIARNQTFPTLRVGTAFSQTVQLTPTSLAATKWTKANLPPGLDIHPTTGVISGTPTLAGEYDQVLITASNGFGSSTSVAFVLRVESLPSLIVGSFSGVITPGENNLGLGGYVTLTTTARATYSGTLRIGKNSYPLAGNLTLAAGSARGSQIIKFNNQDLTLFIGIDGSNGALSGSLNSLTTLTGIRSQTGTTRTGIYNFRFARNTAPPALEPQGASYASISLSTLAVAKVTGRLADGTVFTVSSPLGTDGSISIYQTLYTAPGSIQGSLTLASDNSSTISGNLSWSKPPQTSGSIYRSGWAPPIPLVASGGKYRPAAGATLPMTNTNGAFSGSYSDGIGTARRIVPLQGLLVPDATTPSDFDSTGYGYFILPTITAGVSRSGAVILERLP